MIDFETRLIMAFIVIIICIFISYAIHLYFLRKQNEMFEHFEKEIKDINDKRKDDVYFLSHMMDNMFQDFTEKVRSVNKK